MYNDEMRGWDWFLLCLYVLFGFVLLATPFILFLTLARAQNQDHAAGHNDYYNWSSQRTGNCCNNQDCHGIGNEEWRETENGVEIKIMDVWCPVKQDHLIISGKSPDSTIAHACIRGGWMPAMYNQPCDRLLCFVGPAKI